MGVNLSNVQDESAGTTLTPFVDDDGTAQVVTHGAGESAKTLAVCRQGTSFILAREVDAPTKDKSGTRKRKDADGKERPTEKVLKPTSRLVDIRDALAAGLLTD